MERTVADGTAGATTMAAIERPVAEPLSARLAGPDAHPRDEGSRSG